MRIHNRVPPDFKLAKIHEESQLFKNLSNLSLSNIKNDDLRYCRWWKYPTLLEAPRYEYWVNFNEFKWLGSGIPLYFDFNKFLLIIYLIIFIIAGIPNFIIICQASKADEWSGTDISKFQSASSLGNFGRSSKNYTKLLPCLTIMFNSIAICSIYIINIVYQSYQRKFVQEFDKRVKASDYTLLVSNLPINKKPEEIKAWIESTIVGVKVADVIRVFDIDPYMVRMRELHKLKHQQSSIDLELSKSRLI